MKNTFITVSGFLGGVASYLVGGIDATIQTLLIFMLIDYITGLLLAGVFHHSPKTESGCLESKASWKGLIRKGVTLLIVVVSVRLDMQLGTTYIRDGVCIAFIVNEALSIIENAGLMGVPIPSAIANAIEVLKNKDMEVKE